MSATIGSGPFISTGPLLVPTTVGNVAVLVPESNPEAGPNLSYQGDGILDVRQYVPKDYIPGHPGVVVSHLNSPYILSCDAVPSASLAPGTTLNNLCAAQPATSGTPFTNAAASAGISTSVPFYPFKSQVLTTAPLAVDFGFMAAAASAGVDTLSINGTATATASSLLCAAKFYPGQWLVMPNCLTATTTLITCVLSVVGTTVTFATSAQVAGSNIPGVTTTTAMVGTANIPNTGWLGQPVPTAAAPYLAAGAAGMLDPTQSLMRGWGIFAAAGATGSTVTAAGWDVYGQPQTETLTISAGTTVYGKKTFKYFNTFTPAFTDAGHNYNIGTSDTYGFAVRTDRWEYTNIFYAGAFVASAPGWLAADLTNPATATTGDVRGTFQLLTARGNGTGAGLAAANGSNRLALFLSMPLYNTIQSTPSNPAPFYGQVPA